MQTGIFNPPLMTGWQLLQLPQLPVLNSVWMEQLYNRSSLSTPPVQPKKKSFNIADILSDDKTESDKDIRRMASHPYYPAVQPFSVEQSGKYHFTL